MNKTTCGMPLIDQTGGNSLGFMDEREEARMAGWRMECPPLGHLRPSTHSQDCLQIYVIPMISKPDPSRQIHRYLSQSACSLWVILRVEYASTDWADVSFGGREGHRKGNVPRRWGPIPAGRCERGQVLDLSLHAERPSPR